MYRLARLSNGLTVATAEMPHMASVCVGLWVAVGGRYEPASLNGVSHFIEHLLFKGTRRRSARQISEAVESLGGYLNAFTSEEHTCYYAKARHDYFPDLLEVLVDMVLHSRFAPADVEKERGVIKEELAMCLDQPQQYVQEVLNQLQWPRQPLGRPLTGTWRSLARLTRQDLLSYHRAHYTAANMVVAVAGNIRAQEAVRTVAKVARGFRDGPRRPFPPVRWRQTQPAVGLRTKATAQTQMALGVRAFCRHDPRRHALRLLSTILGESMSSRLFQRVREDSGLAYHIGSSTSFMADTGDLAISAGLEAENLAKVLRIVVQELRRLIRQPVTTAELRRAVDYSVGQLDLSLESTENQMLSIGEQWIGYGQIRPPAAVKRCLARVKPRDVQVVAKELFRADRLNLALVSPLKSEAGLARLLARIGT